jgi:hypothetical protein
MSNLPTNNTQSEESTGIHYRPAIPTMAIWLLVFALITSLDMNGLILWWDWKDALFKALVYFVLGLFLLTWSIENKSAKEFVKALLTYAYDKSLPESIRLNLIQDRVNAAAGLMIALKKPGTKTGLTEKLGLSSEKNVNTQIQFPKPNPLPADAIINPVVPTPPPPVEQKK